MDKEILNALEDSDFAEKILDCISPEEVQEYFEQIGINISDTDANKILCSVYGIEEEAAFVNDYDLALCAGGKDDSKEIGKTEKRTEDEIFKTIKVAVGAEKFAQKIDANRELYIGYDDSKVESPIE